MTTLLEDIINLLEYCAHFMDLYLNQSINIPDAISSIALVKRLVQLSTNLVFRILLQLIHYITRKQDNDDIYKQGGERSQAKVTRPYIPTVPLLTICVRCCDHITEWNWETIYSSFDTNVCCVTIRVIAENTFVGTQLGGRCTTESNSHISKISCKYKKQLDIL